MFMIYWPLKLVLTITLCLPPSRFGDQLDGKPYIEDPNFKGCRAFLMYLILPQNIQTRKEYCQSHYRPYVAYFNLITIASYEKQTLVLQRINLT